VFFPLTPLRCLHRAADLFGNRVGLICDSVEYTYREIKQRVERLATGLCNIGINPGDRVAYLSFNNHQLFEGYFGVPQARAILTPLNVRLSEAELANLLQHSGARVLIYEQEFAPLVARLQLTCADVEHWINIELD